MKKFIALFSLFLGVFTLVGITANASELEEFEADLEPDTQEVIVDEVEEEKGITETALDFLKSLTKSELVVGLCATVGLGVIDVVAILLGIILFLRNKMKQLEKDERFAKILEDKDNEMVKAYDDFKAKLDEYGSMLVKRIDTLDEERKAEAEAKAKAIKDTLEKATSKLSE